MPDGSFQYTLYMGYGFQMPDTNGIFQTTDNLTITTVKLWIESAPQRLIKIKYSHEQWHVRLWRLTQDSVFLLPLLPEGMKYDKTFG